MGFQMFNKISDSNAKAVYGNDLHLLLIAGPL